MIEVAVFLRNSSNNFSEYLSLEYKSTSETERVSTDPFKAIDKLAELKHLINSGGWSVFNAPICRRV